RDGGLRICRVRRGGQGHTGAREGSGLRDPKRRSVRDPGGDRADARGVDMDRRSPGVRGVSEILKGTRAVSGAPQSGVCPKTTRRGASCLASFFVHALAAATCVFSARKRLPHTLPSLRSLFSYLFTSGHASKEAFVFASNLHVVSLHSSPKD